MSKNLCCLEKVLFLYKIFVQLFPSLSVFSFNVPLVCFLSVSLYFSLPRYDVYVYLFSYIQQGCN